MKEFNIKSNCDGLTLYGTIIEPEGDIKGLVHFCHGMAEHRKRYYGVMEFLAKNGYVCMIHDYRGHGQSVLSKDDLGYFYDDSATYIIEDVKQAMIAFKDMYKGLPLTLFGHSMGSLVVRKYIKLYPELVDKLVVCGSPSANPAVSAAILLTKIFTKLKGDHYRPKLIHNMAFSAYDNKFGKNESWLSVNMDNAIAYAKDELCGFMFTCNGFMNLFTLLKDVYDLKGWKVVNKNMPILFIAGQEDPCIGDEKQWLEAQDFLRKVGYTNIEKILYPGMRHEVLLETEKEKVYKDVLQFIKK